MEVTLHGEPLQGKMKELVSALFHGSQSQNVKIKFTPLAAERLAPHNRGDGRFPTQPSDFDVLDSYFHKKWNYEFAIKYPETIRQAISVYLKIVRKTTAAEHHRPFDQYSVLVGKM